MGDLWADTLPLNFCIWSFALIYIIDIFLIDLALAFGLKNADLKTRES